MTDNIYSGQEARIVANIVRFNSKDGSVLDIGTDTGFSLIGARIPYRAETISRTMTLTESGRISTNLGAGGLVELTLPDITVAGITFKFVRVEAQVFRINPPAGSSIKYSGGTMATGEYLGLTSIGAKLHLVSDGNGDWIATYEFGTLTEETP